MENKKFVLWILSMISLYHTVSPTEFTFDLEDSDQECYYELIPKGTPCRLEFQVSSLFQREKISFSVKMSEPILFFNFDTIANFFFQFGMQVLSGGQLDVDVLIENPSRKAIYNELRKEHGKFKFNTTVSKVVFTVLQLFALGTGIFNKFRGGSSIQANRVIASGPQEKFYKCQKKI